MSTSGIGRLYRKNKPVTLVLQKCYKFVMFIPTVDNTRTVSRHAGKCRWSIKRSGGEGDEIYFQKSKPMAVMLNMKLFERLLESFLKVGGSAKGTRD